MLLSGLALGILLACAAVELLRIYDDVRSGRDRLDSLSLESINAAGGLEPIVVEAAGDLDRAERRARTSPFLRVLAPLPLVGTQVDAVRDLTAAADEVGEAARASARSIERGLDDAAGSPPARVALLGTVLRELDRIEAVARAVDVGDAGPLLPQLDRARDQLEANLASVPGRFASARRDVTALRDFLQGPTRHLVLAGNNAEMRGASGMALSAGVLTVARGDFEFGDFVQTDKLHLGARGVTPPAQLAQLYPHFGVGREWRSTTVSPNYPVVAPIYAEMARRAGFGRVESVFLIDVVALETLLEAIGPVELDGFEYTSENVAEQVLNANYLRFDDVGDREARVDLQSRLATAVFEAFKTRDVPITELALGLADAAKGRHLIAWSRDRDMQRLWEKLDAAGQLRLRAILVMASNVGKNKLDWYLDPQVALTSTELHGRQHITLSLTVRHPPIKDSNAFIDGEGTRTSKPGDARVLAGFYLPAAATGIEAVQGELERVGVDGLMRAATIRFVVPRGQTRTVAISFDMPAGQQSAFLLPAARVRPTRWLVDGVRTNDAVGHVISWGGATTTSPSSAQVSAPLFGIAIALVLGAATATIVVAGRDQSWRSVLARFRPR